MLEWIGGVFFVARIREKSAVYRERLKSKGLRHTQPRERILAYLDRKNVHPTPEELYRGLRKKGHDIGLSTIYLNLHVLRDVGLVREFKDPKGQTRFDGWSKPHHHLFCRVCGRVEDLPAGQAPDPMEAKEDVEVATDWRLESAQITYWGLCPRCKGEA